MNDGVLCKPTLSSSFTVFQKDSCPHPIDEVTKTINTIVIIVVMMITRMMIMIVIYVRHTIRDMTRKIYLIEELGVF